MERENLTVLPKSIGLIKLAEFSATWRKDPRNFTKHLKDLYGIDKDTCHALIALFRIESLKQDIAKQAPTEAVTQLALQFFGIGINTGLGSQHITGPEELPLICNSEVLPTLAEKNNWQSNYSSTAQAELSDVTY